LYDVIIVCDTDDGWLVDVVPFHVGRRRRIRCVWVPVVVVPLDEPPEPICVVRVRNSSGTTLQTDIQPSHTTLRLTIINKAK
jgi:hypothetical protein